MASTNPFDLLGDDDNEDPSQLLAAQQQKLVPPKKLQAQAQSAAQPAKPAKLPSKPLPPAEAVREGKNEVGRGVGRGGGHGFGRGRGGGGGFNRDFNNENNSVEKNGFPGGYRPNEEGGAGRSIERHGSGASRGFFRGGRRGGFSNGEDVEGERPRRIYERRSGTGRGNETKREGAGRANWGTPSDEIAPDAEDPITENDKTVGAEKALGAENAGDDNKENPDNGSEEKDPEDKEMTLEEYEKVLEEKRKALLALKTQERKVDLDKDFESMQQLSSKKGNDDIFIKLGSEKDKHKEADKEEKAKKSFSINEFLKPAEGERYNTPGGRGRGRGRGPRGGFSGSNRSNAGAPSIEDQQQFPSLGAK